MDGKTIACDMTTASDTPAERTAQYGRLFGQHLVGRERTVDGIRFRLRADDGVEAWVRELSAKEKACCPFADFAIATSGGEVLWDITVVDDDLARAVLDEFYRIPESLSQGEDWQDMQRRLHDLGFQVTSDT